MFSFVFFSTIYVDFISVDFDKILDKNIYLLSIFVGNYIMLTLPSRYGSVIITAISIIHRHFYQFSYGHQQVGRVRPRHYINQVTAIRRICGSGFTCLETVTVRTPSSTWALTASAFAFLGRQKRRRKKPPEARSTKCHLSVCCTSSFFLSPHISSTLASTICTLICSFFTPSSDSCTSHPLTKLNQTKQEDGRTV